MARSKMTELRVGLFVFLGGLVVMSIIFSLGSQQRMFQRKYVLMAHFPSAAGLRAGAPVRLAGVDVGIIDDIRFGEDPANPNITVTMHIDRSYQERIRTDSRASIQTQGLLGDKYISVTVGSIEASVIDNGGELHIADESSMAALAEKAGSIATDLESAIESAVRIIRTIEEEEMVLHVSNVVKSLEKVMQEDIEPTAEDFRKVMEAIRSSEGTVGLLIHDPSLHNDLRTLFGGANRSKLLRAIIRATMEKNEKQVLK